MRCIDADALKNAKPEFMNEKVVRDTKYQTTKDRIYAKAWNDCNSYWLNAIRNIPTVEERPKGKWVTDELHNTVCSICGGIRRDNRVNHIYFCNECGADMRGDV